MPNFNLLTQFGREMCVEQTKKKKNKPRKKLRFNHQELLQNVHDKFQFFDLIWRTDAWDRLFLTSNKGKTQNPHISPSIWCSKLTFERTVKLLILYCLTSKTNNFSHRHSSTSPLPNLSLTEFWSKVIHNQKYQMRRQTKPTVKI